MASTVAWIGLDVLTVAASIGGSAFVVDQIVTAAVGQITAQITAAEAKINTQVAALPGAILAHNSFSIPAAVANTSTGAWTSYAAQQSSSNFTLTFVGPTSGKVLLEASGPFLSSAVGTSFIGFVTHGTTTAVASNVLFGTQQSTALFTTVKMPLLNLTAGTTYNLDLAYFGSGGYDNGANAAPSSIWISATVL